MKMLFITYSLIVVRGLLVLRRGQRAAPHGSQHLETNEIGTPDPAWSPR